MRWTIDGLNVIGSRPDGWWRDRAGAMRRLSVELATYAARRDEPVTVVFDGAPVPLPMTGDRLRVHFASAPGPGGADDEIVRLVRAGAAGCVVTSDRELARRVRQLGAPVESAPAFRRRLAQTSGSGPAGG